jgi:hypothetical protein
LPYFGNSNGKQVVSDFVYHPDVFCPIFNTFHKQALMSYTGLDRFKIIGVVINFITVKSSVRYISPNLFEQGKVIL